MLLPALPFVLRALPLALTAPASTSAMPLAEFAFNVTEGSRGGMETALLVKPILC
jgi:hypothetical protein